MRDYDNVPTYQKVCRLVRYHPSLTLIDEAWVSGVQGWMSMTGFITYEQRRHLGRLSKKYLQEGRFQLHDWWDGSLDLMLAEIEADDSYRTKYAESDEIVV